MARFGFYITFQSCRVTRQLDISLIFSIVGLYFFLIGNLAFFSMKVGELLDLQVIPLLIFIWAESSMCQLFRFVLVVAHQHQCWLSKTQKSSKTEDSARICDCFIAASLAPSNPVKCTWNQLSTVVGQASLRFCWRNCLKFVCISMLLLAKPQREKKKRTVVSAQLDPSHFTLCWMRTTSMSVSLELRSPGQQIRYSSWCSPRNCSPSLMQGYIACMCSILCPQQDFLLINLQSGQPLTWGYSSSAAGLRISLCLSITTFLLAHFRSLLGSLWMAAQISDSSTTLICCKLAVGALWPHHTGP